MLRPLKPKPDLCCHGAADRSDGHHLSPDRWTEPAPGPAGHGRDYCVAHQAGVFIVSQPGARRSMPRFPKPKARVIAR